MREMLPHASTPFRPSWCTQASDCSGIPSHIGLCTLQRRACVDLGGESTYKRFRRFNYRTLLFLSFRNRLALCLSSIIPNHALVLAVGEKGPHYKAIQSLRLALGRGRRPCLGIGALRSNCVGCHNRLLGREEEPWAQCP